MSAKPPAPPDHLSRRSRKFWRTVAAEYALEPHHLELLRRLCEAMDRGDEAREVIAAEGLTTRDRYDQVKPHPAVNIERDCRIAIARLVRELDLEGEPRPDPRPPRR